MGATVPNEPVGDDRHVMGSTLPLAHQNGSGPSQWRCPAVPGRTRQHASKQAIEFPYRCFPQASVSALLPNIGNAQRQNLSAEGPWRLLTDLLLPEVPKALLSLVQ